MGAGGRRKGSLGPVSVNRKGLSHPTDGSCSWNNVIFSVTLNMAPDVFLLGSRRPRDQVLVDFNEGFHRRVRGARNGPKGLAVTWRYRRVRKA